MRLRNTRRPAASRPGLTIRAAVLIVAAMVLAVSSSWAAATDSPSGPRDRVYGNAKIYTAEPAQAYAEAIAIRGDTILVCGTRAQALAAVGPASEIIDLHGQTLLPGFIDSHTHPMSGGLTLIEADVGESVQTVKELAAFAAQARDSRRGMRGDFLNITGVPLRFWSWIEQLDATFNAGAFAETPMLLQGMDYHTGWANGAMRRRAGVTKEFIANLPEADRKYYGHAADLEPNGFGLDAGIEKLAAALPSPTPDALLAGGRAAVRYYNELGITAWLDAYVDGTNLNTYKTLSDRGELTARVAAFIKVEPRNEPAAELASVEKLRTQFAGITNVALPGIKVFADGVAEFPSQNAAMLQPYRNTGHRGELLFDPPRFATLCIEADRRKLLVHVHAIGDRAVRETLNGIEAARRANGNSRIPHTITHLEFIDPTDVPRFHKLGVLASFQLYWAAANADAVDLIEPYVDPAIYPWIYPARSLLQAGAIVAGASDWAVSTPNVFAAIYQAETRRGPKGVLNPSQTMPREAMLLAYTRNAARALNLEGQIGSLAPGKKADLILLDRDVLTVPAEELKDTKVVWTMFGGQIVYRR